ncbi:MAG TPA: DNA polymerase I [Vicinamibacteria bacterium]|nr:DNA polymerase I [Vicinamibacteria bacterium]
MPRPRTVHLVDGSGQFYRAFHAIRGLATSRGLPTNATYGFTTMLRKMLQDEKPEHVAVLFDPPGRTFRHQQYAEYKANRPTMDSDLAVQVPYIRRVCEAFRLPIIEVAGFEADDVIATLADQAVAAGFKVVIVTADKDMLQLVTGDTVVLNPGREGTGSTLLDRQAVEEKWGVPPERVVDVLALVGDSIDNVPGVPGIGEKGARDLVREYGSVEAVIENADKVKRAAYREGLKGHTAEALLSKQLVTLRRDVPVQLDLEAIVCREPDRAACHALFKELEFQALAREYAPQVVPGTGEHRLLTETGQVRAAVEKARAAGRLALGLVVTSGQAMRALPLGIALSWSEGGSVYVPLRHAGLDVDEALPGSEALALLRPLLEDPAVVKASAHAKRDRIVLGRLDIALEGLDFDALLASYLVDPGRRGYELEDLAFEYLGERRGPCGDGVISQDAAAGAVATAAGSDAELVLRLHQPMTERLREEELALIFQTMEMPLVAVLADMERVGVKVDVEHLLAMSRDMEAQMAALTRQIHQLAKGEFNINSPIQLREVLFDRLGLKSAKKTAKTRAASTAEDVLEELALKHPLPRLILEYRAVQKLKSTYVDALPGLVNPETGRIHTTFSQTVAATGRLSSTDPNLQNIPIRTPEGRRIREAFVAAPGYLLLSADYSQIELRVLAHLSKDPTLIDTFRRGEDVHDRTSREIFGPLSAVPKDEQRRISKMVNYALLYGKSAFTLARDLNIDRRQAEEFVAAYFARYPGVRRFIDETIVRARETGHVRTLLGRLRRLPDLRAKNFAVRMEAERQAMNTPVQGSAADLIKRAMIDLHRELGRRGMASKLILQIHDELLLEVPEAEAEAARELVRSVMEGALQLDVPLVADARLGRSWADVH